MRPHRGPAHLPYGSDAQLIQSNPEPVCRQVVTLFGAIDTIVSNSSRGVVSAHISGVIRGTGGAGIPADHQCYSIPSLQISLTSTAGRSNVTGSAASSDRSAGR